MLTGAGRAFSAGGDAGWMRELADVPGEWQRKAVESRRIWLSLLDLEKPLICRLNGPARGMCATIASLCDVVIAADTATLADTHISMGLAAADGCNAIWPYIVGFAKTKDLLFNATVLTAGEALSLGLITQVVAPAELDAAVRRYVDGLLAKPARALQWTKIAVNAQMKQQVWPAIESALNLLEMSNFSADHRTLLDAFEAANEDRRSYRVIHDGQAVIDHRHLPSSDARAEVPFDHISPRMVSPWSRARHAPYLRRRHP